MNAVLKKKNYTAGQRDTGQRFLKYIFLFLAHPQKRSKKRSGDGLVASTLVGVPSMMVMRVLGASPPYFPLYFPIFPRFPKFTWVLFLNFRT